MKHMKCLLVSIIFCTVFSMIMAGQAESVVITYTSEADFMAGLTANSLTGSTLDFEDLSSGDTIASGDTVEGVTFGFDFGGLDMIVSDYFDTTSPANYLGIDDGGDETFIGGDAFTMSFGPVSALGMYIIGSPGDVWADDFELNIASGSAFNSGIPDLVLDDDGDAFFLGILDTENTFTSAELSSFCCDFFVFNVDDITTATVSTPVPEPGTFVLLFSGLIPIFYLRRRKNGITSSLEHKV